MWILEVPSGPSMAGDLEQLREKLQLSPAALRRQEAKGAPREPPDVQHPARSRCQLEPLGRDAGATWRGQLRAAERSGSQPAGLERLGRSPPRLGPPTHPDLRAGSPERPRFPPLSPVSRAGSDPGLVPDHCSGPGARSNSEGHLSPPLALRSHVGRLRAQEIRRRRARATEADLGLLNVGGEVGGFQHPLLEPAPQLPAVPSLLLPPDNRPLEPSVLRRLKELFARHDAQCTALHMLHMDCLATRITGVTQEEQRAMGVSSGLELITLPHGHQLRRELLERHRVLALGIAVDLLGCTGTVAERTATLHHIIQLARALRDVAGDLFALSAVMSALQLPQIARLEETWRCLRQNHTESAVAFEKDLKPFVRRLSRGEETSTPGAVAVPFVVPLLGLLEGERLWDDHEDSCESLLRTLGAARDMAAHTGRYQAQAEATLQGFQPTPELLEAFQTEFALRLFWGSKGAEASQAERYEKFDRILTVLSQKLEPARKTET
ncbi:SH2 domain-containing protein 3A isoform X1 [Alligator sinensis]|uniref:SH2 domain-containing protein 3A isoform X1 n=2 Tax=Alligator sinensis TaxID=38654 RepID=A0A3Q0GJZ9_ALLSI|nr:SH2 domain-containing protein 3A isoform X1 [Alligator sinensis]